ncbi:MAG: hypothetical protein AAGJ54_09735 [Planctomycetota bacterium]
MSEDLALAREALTRIQSFDVSELPQVDRLGSDNDFRGAVEPAERLIGLWKQLPAESLDNLSTRVIGQVKTQAQASFQPLQEILEFKTDQGQVQSRRDTCIESINSAYESAFNAIYPLIGFVTRTLQDFDRLHSQARASVQEIRDSSDAYRADMTKVKTEAESVLNEVRRVAEEQGVSQEASHFARAEVQHEEAASNWSKRFGWSALGLATFAVGSLFLHKIPILAPETVYEAVQLGLSKLLLFAVLSFVLAHCAKNYLASKHNAVLNRHRQDALKSYQALVKAGRDQENRDIVLAAAAQSIYETKPTGYIRNESAPTQVPLMSVISGATKSAVATEAP